MRSLPIYGKGIGWPFRIHSSTGSVVVTQGGDDEVSVALSYLGDRWTIREDPNPAVNHIAESIAHILMTRQMEHDTLPEFGSDLYMFLFEPNDDLMYGEARHYFSWSTDRWEKRARIPENGGSFFYFDGTLADQGRLPIHVNVRFIVQQVNQNLVAPFVNTEQARLQEYPSPRLDGNRLDYYSRYFGMTAQYRDGIKFLRFPRTKIIPFAPDDTYYKVKINDTWLLASYELYNDIRYWWVIATCYTNDAAAQGLGRDTMDNCGDPVAGTYIRVPSHTRILTEFSGGFH